MENYIESFIAYFYDGDILTDDGIDLTDICGDYLLKEIDGASVICYDIENEGIKMLKDKECKTIIKTKDGEEHVFDRSKIETFKIEYNEENFNAGFYSFRTKLEHKAQQNGKEVVTIGRFYASSQTCSACGAKNKKTKNLSVREWTCPECGTHHDRDVNAAKNIRNEAIRIKNDKGEPTPKNLRRCTPKVRSAENHRNEKSISDGVVSRLVEPEIQRKSNSLSNEMHGKYNGTL